MGASPRWEDAAGENLNVPSGWLQRAGSRLRPLYPKRLKFKGLGFRGLGFRI